jgi:capsular exopolysaccharide synthesis family protein
MPDNRRNGHHSQHQELSLRDFWHLAVRHRLLVLAVAAAVLALAAVYTLRSAPVYESQTTLRIKEEKGSMSLLEDLAPLTGGGQSEIETEMVVLESRQIADQVVDSLSLHVSVNEPRVRRAALFSAVRAPRDVPAGRYELRRRGDGAYDVRRLEGTGQVPAQPLRAGVPATIGGVALTLRPGIGAERVELEVRSFRRTVDDLRETLKVSRPDLKAQVVAVRFRDTDPDMASAVPNATASEFIAYKRRNSKSESSSTVAFLRQQVEGYETQLRGAEGQLRAFREGSQVVSLTAEATEQVKRLAQLQAERDELTAERSALVSVLQRIETASASANSPAPYREIASFPSFLANRAVQDVLGNLIQLENQRAELLVRRTDASVDVQGINERIDQLENQLLSTARGYLQGLDSQLTAVNQSLGRFSGLLTSIPSKEIEFARLARQQTLLQDIYTLLQTRLKEAEIQEAVEPGDVQVVDNALVPEKPVAPRPVLNLAVALMLGLGLGVGAAFVRQVLDTRVRSKDDALQATAGLPVLGTIPRIRMAPLPGAPRVRVGGTALPERLVASADPGNPASEAYRALRTSLTFSNVERPPQVVVVTSAMPGDGKSTSASNLAVTLAQQGTRTLLVDADLRRGVLHNTFGLDQSPGLTHVLHGMSLDEAVREVPLEGLTQPLQFLAAGAFPPNPAETLGSPRMRELIALLRERYDTIVFDAPPLNLVTDAAVLGRSADVTLLVTRVGVTEKAALQHAAEQLQLIGTSVGGLVLNDIDVRTAGYHGYGVYGYAANGSNGKGRG